MRYFLITACILGAVLSSCEQKEPGIKAKYRHITEAVYCTVTVKPEELYTVYPSTGGIIEFSNVEKGMMVEQGDILVKIANQQSEISSSNAKLSYEIAQQNYEGDATILQDLEVKINTAKINKEVDSLNYARQKRLWDQNIGSRQSYESMKLKYGIAANKLSSLQNQYSRTKSELQRKTQQAKNTYRLSNVNQDEFIVRSKIKGRVYDIYKEKGESVSMQTPVATIGSTTSYVLYLLIDEVDITKIYEGQQIEIRLDAYENRTFKAKVTRINPTKDDKTHTFTIEAKFAETPDRLFNGLSGEANIIISTRANVLSIPTQYINDERQVRTDNGLTTIETGVSNLSFTEVISGIDSSVIIYQLEQQ